MEENRRSGFDRRLSVINFPSERRTGFDRRDLIRHQNVLLGKLKNTPLFQPFNEDEFKYILNICSKKTFSKGCRLFLEGEPSNDMYILLEGVLQVNLHGKELSLVTAVDIVGEMGIFSGEPRSATVYAKTDSVLLKINRYELFGLLEANKSINNLFQLGMINNLSEKLRKTNKKIVDLKSR